MQKKIVFIGADGSGKTSVISLLENKLKEDGYSVDKIFMGWRNFLNPFLRAASDIYMKSKSKKNIKEEKLARFKPRSWSFYLIYYSELWLRYIKVLFSKADFILIDRYFYDELAFSDAPKFKLFKLITPQPDFCFLLFSPYEIMKKRGYEGNKENLDRFYAYLIKLKKYFPIVEIDSAGSVDHTSKKITEFIKHKSL